MLWTPWTKARLLFASSAFLGVALAGCLETGGDGPTLTGRFTTTTTPTTDPAEEFLEVLEAGVASLLEGVNDVSAKTDVEDWRGAREANYAVKLELQGLHRKFLNVQRDLDPDDARAFRATFELFGSLLDFLDSGIIWVDEVVARAAELENAQTDSEALQALYALELTSDLGEVAARDADAIAVQGEFLLGADPDVAARLNIDTEFVATFRSSAEELRSAVREMSQVIDDATEEYKTIYVEPQERILPEDLPVAPPPETLVSADVRSFYASFDADEDGSLSIQEAKSFYGWVEDHVAYRYDDEGETDPYPGYVVGDGRAGPDYQQSPTETFAERMGDCEDMNTLEVAFYNHWGITAYQAYVNAVDEFEYDHAIAIVLLGDSLQDAQAIVGNLEYYEFGPDNQWQIPTGFYMIVDNAYSDEFGAISGGVEPGRFQVFEIHALGQDLENYVQ